MLKALIFITLNFLNVGYTKDDVVEGLLVRILNGLVFFTTKNHLGIHGCRRLDFDFVELANNRVEVPHIATTVLVHSVAGFAVRVY